MARSFHASRFDLFLLVTNLICLGACVVLLATRGREPVLVAITVGVVLMIVAKLVRGFTRRPPVGPDEIEE